MRLRSVLLCAGILMLLPGVSGTARASFHLWQVVQAYSNASGTVQYVVLQTDFGGQNSLHTFSADFVSNGHTYFFNQDIVGDTTNKKILLATPGYDALSGVPLADYHLGVNSFFNPAGDTLNFDGFNTLTFTSGQLPTDGTNALFRAINQTTLTTGINAPTNFAGQTGTVPAPEPAMISLIAVGFVSLFRRPAFRQ